MQNKHKTKEKSKRKKKAHTDTDSYTQVFVHTDIPLKHKLESTVKGHVKLKKK